MKYELKNMFAWLALERIGNGTETPIRSVGGILQDKLNCTLRFANPLEAVSQLCETVGERNSVAMIQGGRSIVVGTKELLTSSELHSGFFSYPKSSGCGCSSCGEGQPSPDMTYSISAEKAPAGDLLLLIAEVLGCTLVVPTGIDWLRTISTKSENIGAMQLLAEVLDTTTANGHTREDGAIIYNAP
ncbi:hypothetical protein U2F10_17975 [Leptothoe sp. EHU-05/26/07-4]